MKELSDDELQSVLLFLHVRESFHLLSVCKQWEQAINSSSYSSRLLQLHAQVPFATVQTNDHKQLIRELFSNMKWSTAPEGKDPTLTLSQNDTCVSNMSDATHLPIRMVLPIIKSERLTLEVKLTNVNRDKYYGTGLGVVSSLLLTDFFNNGFSDPVFNKKLADGDRNKLHCTIQALHLGHYYYKKQDPTAHFGRRVLSSTFPSHYFNCGYFDNGFITFNTVTVDYFAALEYQGVITMKVNLLKRHEKSENNLTGYVSYYMNGAHVTTINGIFDPNYHTPYDLYVTMNLGRQFIVPTQTRYILEDD